MAHRDAVGDRDRHELDREAAGVAHADLGPLGQPVERHVARRDLVPRDATPTCALPQSASVMPIARNIARAGARSLPSVTSWLRGRFCSLSAIRPAYLFAVRALPENRRRRADAARRCAGATDRLRRRSPRAARTRSGRARRARRSTASRTRSSAARSCAPSIPDDPGARGRRARARHRRHRVPRRPHRSRPARRGARRAAARRRGSRASSARTWSPSATSSTTDPAYRRPPQPAQRRDARRAGRRARRRRARGARGRSRPRGDPRRSAGPTSAAKDPDARVAGLDDVAAAARGSRALTVSLAGS